MLLLPLYDIGVSGALLYNLEGEACDFYHQSNDVAILVNYLDY